MTAKPQEKPESATASTPTKSTSPIDSEELLRVKGGWLTTDRSIPVEDDDIAHGVKRDQWGCAIVRAIQKKYPGALRVRVNAQLIGFSLDEIRYTYPTPPEAVEGIIKPFDQGGKAEPMTLRLRGGKMRDVEHSDDRTLQVQRNYKRDRKSEVTERQGQMSPNYHEYERF